MVLAPHAQSCEKLKTPLLVFHFLLRNINKSVFIFFLIISIDKGDMVASSVQKTRNKFIYLKNK